MIYHLQRFENVHNVIKFYQKKCWITFLNCLIYHLYYANYFNLLYILFSIWSKYEWFYLLGNYMLIQCLFKFILILIHTNYSTLNRSYITKLKTSYQIVINYYYNINYANKQTFFNQLLHNYLVIYKMLYFLILNNFEQMTFITVY